MNHNRTLWEEILPAECLELPPQLAIKPWMSWPGWGVSLASLKGPGGCHELPRDHLEPFVGRVRSMGSIGRPVHFALIGAAITALLMARRFSDELEVIPSRRLA